MALARRLAKAAAAATDRVRSIPPGLVVLIYHRVGRQSSAELDLSAAAFSEQMAYLRAKTTVTTLTEGLRALAEDASPNRRLVAVTFDDGTADFADRALPILVEHAVPVTLYLATQYLETGTSFPLGGTPLSWSAVRDAVATGLVDVGSHTHSHALLDRLPEVEVVDELTRSIDLLRERAGVRAEHFAYPKAVPGSPAADAAVRAHFRSAALAGTRVNRYGGTDPYRVARSPIQHSDGMQWFQAKVAGGMALEDALRRGARRVREAIAPPS